MLRNRSSRLPRNVIALGWVSLLTDFSSEMIYPLLPVLFAAVIEPGMVALYVGVMDGIAESTSSLLKIIAGRWSDRSGRRKPLTLLGYSVSTLARPAMALATTGWQVVGLRFLDRVGKGTRTAPRDALLAGAADHRHRAWAFSFHRMMDHVGAVLGPVTAALLLWYMLGDTALMVGGADAPDAAGERALRLVFAAAAIPGVLALCVLALAVREVPLRRPMATPAADPAKLPQRTRWFLAAVILFGLGNSSDLFLIWYARTTFGLGFSWLLVLWLVLHLAKIASSLPGGWLADRWPRARVIGVGWLIYAAIYLIVPHTRSLGGFVVLLCLYGVYYGLTEGAEKALIADDVPETLRGRAYGWYHGLVGLAALPASLLFGVFWTSVGATVAFTVGASLAVAAVGVLIIAHRRAPAAAVS